MAKNIHYWETRAKARNLQETEKEKAEDTELGPTKLHNLKVKNWDINQQIKENGLQKSF